MAQGFVIVVDDTLVGFELPQDGLTVVSMDYVGRSQNVVLYAQTTDFGSRKRRIWYSSEVNGVCRIQFDNVQQQDLPLEEDSVAYVLRPLTKLERFYMLESELKEKGLI